MKLVLVHGINQQNNEPDALKARWVSHLTEGLGDPQVMAQFDVHMPYYGDLLHQLTRSGPSDHVVAQGDAATGDAEAEFIVSALGETVEGLGLSRQQIMAEQRLIDDEADDAVVAQGFPMHRKINAIVRVLERVSPLHGSLMLRLLKQAYAYLRRPGVDEEIDALVSPHLTGGPLVIVAHSLGTVVTFKLLRRLALENRALQVPLYVTLGSPLPIMAVQAALGPRFEVPKGVTRWLNAIDPDDFITLGSGLTRSSFAEGIENLLNVDNLPSDQHAVAGYLRDSRVARAIQGTMLAGGQTSG